MKKILVTGSNGFIGSNLCRYLKSKDCHIIGLGRRDHSSCIYADEYIACDLSSESSMSILKGLDADAVVHLASDMRHAPFEADVVYHNCVGTQRLLEACEAAEHVGVFVQLSSLPVIGKPVQLPVTEDHPIKPPTAYHVTKFSQELLANYASYTYGLRTVSFRISAPVGIGMNLKTIFPTFVRRALNNEDIVLFGKGTRKQTYIHVDDISQAVYKAVNSPNAQGVYNLSSNNLLSNEDLARRCVNVLDSRSNIIFNGEEDPEDNLVWEISLSKIMTDLNYKPMIPIEYAIRELADHFRVGHE